MGKISEEFMDCKNVVMVQLSAFPQDYAYAFAGYDDFKKGDRVVCNTVNGFALGIVSEVKENDNYKGHTVTNEIVSKFDISDHTERVERRKNKKDLMNKMSEKAKEFKKMSMYKMMAEQDPEMKKMLEEYENL